MPSEGRSGSEEERARQEGQTRNQGYLQLASGFPYAITHSPLAPWVLVPTPQAQAQTQPSSSGHPPILCKNHGCVNVAAGRSAKRARSALCAHCAKAERVFVHKDTPERFCQYCRALHRLDAFDGTQRSCKTSLRRARKKRNDLGPSHHDDSVSSEQYTLPSSSQDTDTSPSELHHTLPPARRWAQPMDHPPQADPLPSTSKDPSASHQLQTLALKLGDGNVPQDLPSNVIQELEMWAREMPVSLQAYLREGCICLCLDVVMPTASSADRLIRSPPPASLAQRFKCIDVTSSQAAMLHPHNANRSFPTLTLADRPPIAVCDVSELGQSVSLSTRDGSLHEEHDLCVEIRAEGLADEIPVDARTGKLRRAPQISELFKAEEANTVAASVVVQAVMHKNNCVEARSAPVSTVVTCSSIRDELVEQALERTYASSKRSGELDARVHLLGRALGGRGSPSLLAQMYHWCTQLGLQRTARVLHLQQQRPEGQGLEKSAAGGSETAGSSLPMVVPMVYA